MSAFNSLDPRLRRRETKSVMGKAIYWCSASQEIARNLSDLPESDFDHMFFNRRYYQRKLQRALRIVELAQLMLFTSRTAHARTIAIAKKHRANAH